MVDYEKKELLYRGKAKEMFATNVSDVVWVHYMDQVTALNGKKKVQMTDKGTTNNQISSLIFSDLTANGIPNDFIKQIDANNQLVKKVQIIPLEVVIRNFVSGSFERKFAVDHLLKFEQPVKEFFYKSDKLDDPFINDSQIKALNIATQQQLDQMRDLALKINQRLRTIFAAMQIELIDFKVEFGLDQTGEIILADEISPDSCRLVDQKTKESLDKDVFRKGLGELVPVYKTVLQRLQKVEGHN